MRDRDRLKAQEEDLLAAQLDSLEAIQSEKEQARAFVHRQMARITAPELVERRVILGEIEELRERRRRLRCALGRRTDKQRFVEALSDLEVSIGRLEERLGELRARAPELTAIAELLERC